MAAKFETEPAHLPREGPAAIKNLMGKYANCLILNRGQTSSACLVQDHRPHLLAFNDGVYRGAAAVKEYYDACAAQRAGGGTDAEEVPQGTGRHEREEIYGSPLQGEASGLPLVRCASDGHTAKGMWYCLAPTTTGDLRPVAHWTGVFPADFVREDGAWKIWHMQYLNDVDCICGQRWGKEPKALPEREEFMALKEFR
jgi:hypothetical protein